MDTEESGASGNANTPELYKRYRLNLEKDIGLLDFSKKGDEYFEEFSGNIAERLHINIDAVVGKKGYMLNDSSVRFGKDSKKGSAGHVIWEDEKDLVEIIEKYTDRKVIIECGENEKRKVVVVFANMDLPLVTKIEIKAARGSKLEVMEIFTSKASRNSLNLSFSGIEVGSGAEVEINALHNEDANTNAVHFGNVSMKESGRIRINEVYEGGKNLVARNYIDAAGYGAQAEINSTLISSGEQRFDVFNTLVNSVSGTSCLGETKSVLTGKSINFIKDMAFIPKMSSGSRSYIKERAILMSKDARANLLPDMSIYENDVKASHSAAAAPIDAEAEFYLMSRGLTLDKSANMVARGFLSDIISKIEDGAAKAIIMSHVNDKLMNGRFGELLESNLSGVWEEHTKSTANFFEGGVKYSNG